jgi:multiple sugar transport system permease protein
MSTFTVDVPESPASARPPRARRRRVRLTPGNVVLVGCIALLMLVTLFPFYWSLRTALSSNRALPSHARDLLPADFSWGGFKRALGLSSTAEALAEGGSGAKINFLVALRNSLIVSTMVTVGQVLCCSLAAYAFARLRFRGRNLLFYAVLAALMVPPVFLLLPNFIFVKERGLLDSYLGIAAPKLLMTPFAIFFLRQFLLGVPREIEEAAIIDGAGRFRIFWQVVMPMVASPLATLGVLTFIEQWNDYLWPKLVAQSDNVRVLTTSLGYFRSQTPQGTPDWSGLMAATWVSALPIFILLLLTGKRVVNSIQFSGIK